MNIIVKKKNHNAIVELNNSLFDEARVVSFVNKVFSNLDYCCKLKGLEMPTCALIEHNPYKLVDNMMKHFTSCANSLWNGNANPSNLVDYTRFLCCTLTMDVALIPDDVNVQEIMFEYVDYLWSEEREKYFVDVFKVVKYLLQKIINLEASVGFKHGKIVCVEVRDQDALLKFYYHQLVRRLKLVDLKIGRTMVYNDDPVFGLVDIYNRVRY